MNSEATIIGKNIKNLREILKKTQKDFAKELHISTPTLSSYENGFTLPSLEILFQLKNRYFISIDKFTSELLLESDFQQANSNLAASYQPSDINKYYGTYIMYYFNTSANGSNEAEQDDYLKAGLLTLYSKCETATNVIGCFNLNTEKLEHIYTSIKKMPKTSLSNENNNIHLITQMYIEADTSNVYKGEASFSADSIFINLIHNNRDCALIILRNPPSEKDTYIGGLGTINSVSKGSYHNPCAQNIALTRFPLSISLDDIVRELQFKTLNLNMHNETIELVNSFKNLYSKPTIYSLPFSDEQKNWFIQSLLEKYVDEAITANLFRVLRVSPDKDDIWYHLVKRYAIRKGKKDE